jgi:DHA1 family bicyclomycin/chloramphenicol resistance-like MFS transporter
MPRSGRSNLLIILILGALSTVSPFSIDMYLPAFPQIAHDLGTTPAQISLSVSGYFIGLALCVAQVGAIAMVRDFFPARESAKILSLLMLVLSVSPLFAPSIGSLIATTIGWPWIFVILAAFALFLMIVIGLLLPEGHRPDPEISLLPRAILEGFQQILMRPQFYTYALAGAFAFAGLFVYVTGSPIIFIDGFLIFAALACSFIGGSQLNIWLSRRHEDHKIFRVAVICQNVIMLIILVGTLYGWYGLSGNIVLLLLYLPFCGMAYPNAAAIALAPFSKNVGSASAVLGFLQMGIGAFASTGVGLLNASSSLTVFIVMAATAFIGLLILLANHRRVLIVRAGEA